MGLCKCPKRQITTQFCFEHRVNVCEFCMVTNHPKCIVQSYIQWLKDSDYDSSCGVCGSTLENGECIRLICYHVFHWHCLNKRQSALPANTAPGGHTCPTCAHPIFPPPNLISPVADVVRNRLGQVNWGRNELGLPLLSGERIEQPITPKVPERTIVHTKVSDSAKSKANGAFYNNSDESTENNSQSNSPHSVLLMDSFNPQSSDLQANSRRPLLPRQSPIGSVDRDDNKYKRRTPAEIFSRWSRRFYAPSSRPPWRRTWFIAMMGIITFVVVIYLLAAFGRGGSSDEWEVDQNPNPKHYD